MQVLFKLLLTFAEVILVKASHMDTPRVSGGGDSTSGILRGIKARYWKDTPLDPTPGKVSHCAWLFISVNYRAEPCLV